MFNPANASLEIKREYIDYIATRNYISDPEMRESFKAELYKNISKGPILDIKDPFETDLTVRQLIQEGVLDEEFENIERQKADCDCAVKPKIPLDRSLYTHQVKAIKRITSGNNAVITTGTGSGKTECFMIPILNDLAKRIRTGELPKYGIQALLIYPMNALANDQMKRLREILMYYPEITFGVYNGDTKQKESDGIAQYRTLHAQEELPLLRTPLDNECVSRDRMRETPPHILCTNYAMLEHLLLRPDDEKLFTASDMRYVVLDEAHVYHGSTGMETALLLRRLKARIASSVGTRFILTSATLGKQNESEQSITAFASNLTGEAFDAEDIIFGKRQLQTYTTSSDIPVDFFNDVSNLKGLNGLREVYSKYSLAYDDSGDEAANLYDVCYASELYHIIRSRIHCPTELDKCASLIGLDKNSVIRLMFVLTQAYKNGVALVDVRYHFFLKALEGLYFTPGLDKAVSLNRITQRSFNGESYASFELAVCSDCGELAIVGQIERNDETGLDYVRMTPLNKTASYFSVFDTVQADTAEVDIDDDAEESDDSESKKPKSLTSTRYLICSKCGAISPYINGAPHCKCVDARILNVTEIEGSHKCRHCLSGDYYRFYLSNVAATAVLATSLYETLEPREMLSEEDDETRTWEGGRQFLAFSDNRADAAYFAPYMTKHYNEFLRRRAIVLITSEHKADILAGTYTTQDLAFDLKQLFVKEKTFAETLDTDSIPLRQLENTAKKQAWFSILNAMLTSRKSDSLTSLGFVQFKYMPLYKGKPNAIEYFSQKYSTTTETMDSLLNSLIMSVVACGALRGAGNELLESYDLINIYHSDVNRYLIRDRTENSKRSYTGWMPRNIKGKSDAWYPSARQYMVMDALNTTDPFEANRFLAEAFDSFLLPVFEKNQRQYGQSLKASLYEFRVEDFEVLIPGHRNARWYKCQKCGRISPFSFNGKCCVHTCKGTVEPMSADDIQSDNHFANIYRKSLLKTLLIKEHTAQLSRKESSQYQLDFEKNLINALSCSTTFEMGVDVGDLETVFMRDIPPTAANYAQRAGRAGRSKHAAAYSLTYAKLSSHDFTMFERPNDLIEGRIMPPVFKVENRKILLRHIFAVALSWLFHSNPACFGNNRMKTLIDEHAFEGMKAAIARQPDGLTDILRRSFGEKLDSEFGITSYAWADDFIGENGAFAVLIREFEQTIKEFTDEMDKCVLQGMADAQARTRYGHLEHQLDLYKSSETIDMLSRYNVLPKYGFPVDTAELIPADMYSDGVEKEAELQLVRDTKIAISEYAPGSKIIAADKMFTSRYIKKSMASGGNMDFHYGYVAKCGQCGAWNFARLENSSHECIACKALVTTRWTETILPIGGFIAQPKPEPVPMKRPRHGYSNDACYIGNGKQLDTYEYIVNGRTIKLNSSVKDRILILSRQRFYVCKFCGYAISETEKQLNGKPLTAKQKKDIQAGKSVIEVSDTHNDPRGRKCNSTTLKREFLSYVFETDVVRMEFDTFLGTETEQLSLMHALLRAMSETLEVEDTDIGACIESASGNYTVIFYDACAGGAGHVHRLLSDDGKMLNKVLTAAYQIVSSCNCGSSCYSCLRNYHNQWIHDKLDRNEAAKVLEKYSGNFSSWLKAECVHANDLPDEDGR